MEDDKVSDVKGFEIGPGFGTLEIEKIIEMLQNKESGIEDIKWVQDLVSGIVVRIVGAKRFDEILKIMDMNVAFLVDLMRGFRIFSREFGLVCNAVNFKAMEIIDLNIVFERDEAEVLGKSLEFLRLFEKYPGIIDQGYLIDHLSAIVRKLESFDVNPFFEDMLSKIEFNFQYAENLVPNITNLIVVVKSRLNLLSIFKQASEGRSSRITTLEDLANESEILSTIISDSTNYSEDKLSSINIKITEITTNSTKVIKKEYKSNSYSAFTENAKEELKIYLIIQKEGLENKFVKLFDFSESSKNNKLKLTMLIEKIDLKFSQYYQDIVCYGNEELIKNIILSIKDQIIKLHSIGIIYNDLSVSNVVINNSEAFLVDFNCSFFIGQTAKCLINTKKIGNKEFLSPELYIALENNLYETYVDYTKSEYFSFSLFLLYIFRNYFTNNIVKLVQNANRKLSKNFKRALNIDKLLLSKWINNQENEIRSCIISSHLFDWAKDLILSSLKFDPTARTLTP